MTGIRRLLLALDLAPDRRGLSAGSRLAADQALRLATTCGAEVTLLHSTAADEVWDPAEGYVVSPDGLEPPGRDALEVALEEFRTAGVRADLTLSEEPSWLAIVHRVLREGSDLVVSGKRNEAESHGPRVGSVAMKLLRKCPCAVWVARPGGAPAPRRVLAASDLSPVGERVIELATFVAAEFRASLHVVHAFQLPFAVQWEGDAAQADFEHREREVRRERLEAQVAQTKFPGEVHYYAGLTSPSRAILSCDERLDPDLVVLGTISRAGIAGLLVGNTAERLLGRLDCSLLTVKPDDFVCPVAAA